MKPIPCAILHIQYSVGLQYQSHWLHMQFCLIDINTTHFSNHSTAFTKKRTVWFEPLCHTWWRRTMLKILKMYTMNTIHATKLSTQIFNWLSSKLINRPKNEVCEGYVFTGTSCLNPTTGGIAMKPIGGAMWLLMRGAWLLGGVCVVAHGGIWTVWLFMGGMRGFLGGKCTVAFWGGMHGFYWGAMHGFFWRRSMLE